MHTSNLNNLNYMFSNCKSLEVVDLSRFDTTSVTDMSYMFFKCEALKSVNLEI